MENVTDRVSNPFGFTATKDSGAVFGYGDANADVHVIGDHPGVHGGISTGIPFTDTESGDRLRDVLATVGLLDDPTATEPNEEGVYLSYLHPEIVEGTPTEASYTDQERFLDAEVRAITSHILIPVGERAFRHVLERYTAEAPTTTSLSSAHATELGTGAFLVVPTVDPALWSDTQAAAFEERLRTVLSRDYARQSDLGRFLPGGDPYYVR